MNTFPGRSVFYHSSHAYLLYFEKAFVIQLLKHFTDAECQSVSQILSRDYVSFRNTNTCGAVHVVEKRIIISVIAKIIPESRIKGNN